MKKKIAIVTVCALVTLISMTSTIFAGGSDCTSSFHWCFWNADPWIGTSYAVTYLDTIKGTNQTCRYCYASASILREDSKTRNYATPDIDPNNLNRAPNLATSVNSDSKNPRSSDHTAYIKDNFGTFTKHTTSLLAKSISGDYSCK